MHYLHSYADNTRHWEARPTGDRRWTNGLFLRKRLPSSGKQWKVEVVNAWSPDDRSRFASNTEHYFPRGPERG